MSAIGEFIRRHRRPVVAAGVVLVLVLVGAVVFRRVGGGRNPVIDANFPDPAFLVEDLTYYAFATNNGEDNIQLQTSTDLINFTPRDDALPEIPTWASAGETWAPDPAKIGDNYLLYFAAAEKKSGDECLGVALSRKPEGPYEPVGDEPLVCQADLGGAIDPTFYDDDGELWLGWKSDGDHDHEPVALWTQRLDANGTGLLAGSKPQKVLTPDADWQNGIIEAPEFHRRAGTLYLFYSANWFNTADYGIGYATCQSFEGPCENQSTDGAFVRSGHGAEGPGGQNIFADVDGSLWLAFHAWKRDKVGGDDDSRVLWIDPISFSGSGPSTDAPSRKG